MGTAERRYEMMKILCRRRYETIRNLASEFGVSMRTVQRDIEALIYPTVKKTTIRCIRPICGMKITMT